MESRFLSRLDEELAAAGDRFSRRCLLAERAAYRARLGYIDSARTELEYIRSENDSDPHIRVSIYINIADGLCHYYQDMSPEASDRYHRARALAVASSQGDLQARADSLLAVLAFGDHHFEKMFTHLDNAMEQVSPTDSQTLCRVCMLVGQTLHLANSFELASEWYQQARFLANETLDDASMSAILHNMSTIWSVNLRNSQLGRIETQDRALLAWSGVDSNWNFDKMVGSNGLGFLTPLVRAQMLSMEDRHEEALAIYKMTVQSLILKALGGWQAWILADMAWCSLRLGNTEEARIGFSNAIERLKDNHHLDDRAATLTRLSGGMEILGETELATTYKKSADEAWGSFTALQSEMRGKTQRFLERRGPALKSRSRG